MLDKVVAEMDKRGKSIGPTMKLTRRNTFNSVSCLLVLAANQAWACQQGNGTNSIVVLPTLGGSVVQANALNAAGQITGVSFLAGDTAAHAFRYSAGTMTDLGTLGGDFSFGFAINASGQVAGQADLASSETRAVIYDGTTLLNLGTLGGSFSSAAANPGAINSAGAVVGDSLVTGDGAVESFLYANGVMTGLGDLGGGSSSGTAINQNGNITGNSFNLVGENHAFFYSNGSMIDLGTLGGIDSLARAINDSDMVVGESTTASGDIHAFAWTSGPMTDLGTLGGLNSRGFTVNNAGQVIGDSDTAGGRSHGFIFSGGLMTDLGTLGGNYSTPQGMNNLGQVVGDSAIAGGTVHAFLWQNGTMTDLNSTLPAGSGWVLTSALMINDNGRIVGFGELNGQVSYFIMDIVAANTAPIANAGADQNVECQTAATLDGSQSSDPDNDALTYSWSDGVNVLGTNPVLVVTLPIGTHTLTLTVTDPCSASAQDSVVVVVADTTAPTIVSGPALGTISANNQCQAAVPSVVSGIVATDNCTAANALSIQQNPVAGAPVGLGSHSIVVTVTDASGNSTSGSIPFTVADTTAPTITSAPSSATGSPEANCQAAVPNFLPLVSATDNCTSAGSLVKTQSPAAGTLVGVGSHNVTITVTDAAGNFTTTTVVFVVADTTAPTIQSVSSNPNVLSPPNHQLVPITVSVVATDNCDPSPVSQIISVTANETVDPGDITITGNLTVTLAASKNSMGNSRIYTITVRTTDASGNSSTATTTVTVPKSSSGTGGSKP
jgi:probable HAF family extracellular repeat protein